MIQNGTKRIIVLFLAISVLLSACGQKETATSMHLVKAEGEVGVVDKDGKVIVNYVYDDATEQNAYGYVGVKKDGKWGSLDNKGNIVQEPTYNLEDYLKIDFIGRWHYGKDINMNYYNQI